MHFLLELFNLVISLLVIVDPFAVVPVFLTITQGHDRHYQRRMATKASVIATCLLLFVCFAGMRIFDLFGITLPAFQIAGGILLLQLGLEQLKAERRRVRSDEESESVEKEDVSVFPLATPLLAGPGAISTVVLLTGTSGASAAREVLSDRAAAPALQGVSVAVFVSLAILIVMFISWLMLIFAPKIYRALGKTGLNLLTRIMGILLTAIAIQFMINGIRSIYESW